MARHHYRVQRTAGTLRVLWAFLELWQFSVSKPFSPQPPVTPALGRHWQPPED